EIYTLPLHDALPIYGHNSLPRPACPHARGRESTVGGEPWTTRSTRRTQSWTDVGRGSCPRPTTTLGDAGAASSGGLPSESPQETAATAWGRSRGRRPQSS